MFYIKEKTNSEISIEKSKFIGFLVPLNTVDDLKVLLSEIKKEYPKATHYCYAYKFEGVDHSYDDKEPSGTAGRPLLEFLKAQQLDHTLAVVVRYFGGIKLGVGGLKRAYLKSILTTYNVTPLLEGVMMSAYIIKVEYSDFDVLKHHLNQDSQIIIQEVTYGDLVALNLLAKDLDTEKLITTFNGKLTVEFIDKKLHFIDKMK